MCTSPGSTVAPMEGSIITGLSGGVFAYRGHTPRTATPHPMVKRATIRVTTDIELRPWWLRDPAANATPRSRNKRRLPAADCLRPRVDAERRRGGDIVS